MSARGSCRPYAPSTACRSAARAAALQFCLANPLVCSVIPGAQSAEEAAQNKELVDTAVPAAVWREMREAGLIRAHAPTPDASATL